MRPAFEADVRRAARPHAHIRRLDDAPLPLHPSFVFHAVTSLPVSLELAGCRNLACVATRYDVGFEARDRARALCTRSGRFMFVNANCRYARLSSGG